MRDPNEPMIFETIRRNPYGQVRVYGADGQLIAGQPCYQVVPPEDNDE